MLTLLYKTKLKYDKISEGINGKAYIRWDFKEKRGLLVEKLF